MGEGKKKEKKEREKKREREKGILLLEFSAVLEDIMIPQIKHEHLGKPSIWLLFEQIFAVHF